MSFSARPRLKADSLDRTHRSWLSPTAFVCDAAPNANLPNESDAQMETEPLSSDLTLLVQTTQQIWEQKARAWDERMGDGNLFQRLLIGPACERLLRIQASER